MSLNPYLYFAGNCRQAFELYRAVFAGDFSAMQTFADGPADMPVAEADKTKVMHVSLSVGASVLMESDVPGDGADHVVGTNVQISHDPPSRSAAEQRFARLAQGGTVDMPLEDQFWGAYFGR